MTRSSLARLLMVFAALWLPLQAVATLAMPSCRHAAQQAHQAAHSPQVATQHGDTAHCEHADHATHDANTGHEAAAAQAQQDSAPPADAGHACHACGSCHLTGGGAALPTVFSAPATLPHSRDYALPTEHPLDSHIPEQPRRPPRLRA